MMPFRKIRVSTRAGVYDVSKECFMMGNGRRSHFNDGEEVKGRRLRKTSYFATYVYLQVLHQFHHHIVHLLNNKENLTVVLRKLLAQALMQLARRWVSQADALKGRLEMHPLDLQVGLKRTDRIVIASVCFQRLRVLLQRPDDNGEDAEG